VSAREQRRTALVTGGARGIGAAIAARLRVDGFDVLTLDRLPGCTYQVEIGKDPLPDLSHVDVCVANAALTTNIGSAHRFPVEVWQRDIDVNLTGTFHVVQACLGGMRERGYGRIIAISSTAASRGQPAQVGYSAAKAGLHGMIKTIAAENAVRGITANLVLPGMTASEGMLAMPAEILEGVVATLAMGTMVPPSEIAAVVALLAAEEMAHLTGQEISVDGGEGLETRSMTRSSARGSA
jgi:NAD(P)-dependent dehydrogenase (short-subunit alcohol dehydrogenase family)